MIAARHGCDRRPLDPGDPADRLRLRAYVWADQRARLARLDAVLAHAAASDVRVARADAADWLEERLAAPAAAHATVVLHSVVWQYLPETTQAWIAATLGRAGRAATAEAPLAWLRMEPAAGGGHAELRVTRWPGGADRHLADADFHGRWVRWLGGERPPRPRSEP